MKVPRGVHGDGGGGGGDVMMRCLQPPNPDSLCAISYRGGRREVRDKSPNVRCPPPPCNPQVALWPLLHVIVCGGAGDPAAFSLYRSLRLPSQAKPISWQAAAIGLSGSCDNLIQPYTDALTSPELRRCPGEAAGGLGIWS